VGGSHLSISVINAITSKHIPMPNKISQHIKIASTTMLVILIVGAISIVINSIEARKIAGAATTSKFALPPTKIAQIDDRIRQVADTPLRPEDYFISAQRKYGKKDYQGALSDYNRAISINPKFAQGYGGRGTVKDFQLHDYRGALADYNRAIQLKPDLAIVYKFRGTLKGDRLQDYRGALADYDRAILIDPNLAAAYGGRGELKHDRLNDTSGAIADTQQAAKLFKQQGDLENYQIAIRLLKKWHQTDRKSLR
jgi:tetratricopeptide (TPR) repeat protein